MKERFYGFKYDRLSQREHNRIFSNNVRCWRLALQRWSQNFRLLSHLSFGKESILQTFHNV